MKRTLIILATVIFVLPLTAWMHTSGSNISNNQPAIIRKNSRTWKKEISDLPIIKSDGLGDSGGYIAQSMQQLKSVNDSVINGTVYSLERMESSKNLAFTRATVHVDKVISGDKELKGKNIQMVLNSGITSTSCWYADKNQTREADHDILVQYSEFPLPEIGSKIILGISSEVKNETTPYNEGLKQSGLHLKKSYIVNMPEFNLWIKDSKDRKYRLNNPKANEKLKANKEMKRKITKLTDELNQKY